METLLKDNPEDSILHYNRGVAYRDKKQIKDAISELQKSNYKRSKGASMQKLLKQLTMNNQGLKAQGILKKEKGREEKQKIILLFYLVSETMTRLVSIMNERMIQKWFLFHRGILS